MKAGRPSKENNNELKLSDLIEPSKKTARVNFNIDKDKYIKFKKYALDNHKTVTELLTEMIEEKLVER